MVSIVGANVVSTDGASVGEDEGMMVDTATGTTVVSAVGSATGAIGATTGAATGAATGDSATGATGAATGATGAATGAAIGEASILGLVVTGKAVIGLSVVGAIVEGSSVGPSVGDSVPKIVVQNQSSRAELICVSITNRQQPKGLCQSRYSRPSARLA